MTNPVMEEATELYIHSREFLKLHVGYLLLLGLFLVIVWPSRSYMYFFRTGTVPPVFLANTVFLIILSGVVSFYVGLDQIARARLIRYSEWLERTRVPVRSFVFGKILTAALHTLFLIGIGLPVLVAAAGPSGVPLQVLPGLVLVLYLSALACRVAAMIISHYGEESEIVRTVGVWVFGALLFVVSLRVFRPLNPVVAAVSQIAIGAPGAVAGVGTGEWTRNAGLLSLIGLTLILGGFFWVAVLRHRRIAERKAR